MWFWAEDLGIEFDRLLRHDKSAKMDLSDKWREGCSKVQRKSVTIVSSIWLLSFLSVFVLKSMGVLLPVLLAQFEAYTRNVGVVVSLVFVCGNVIAMFAQSLTRIMNTRITIIGCGILTTVGLVISSLANSMSVLVMGMTLTGFSNMSNVIAFGVIPKYFPTECDIITNIVATALPIAIMVSTPITQLLLYLYGWRGCLLIISAIMFNIIPCAAVLPLERIPTGYEAISGDSVNFQITRDDTDGNTDSEPTLVEVFTSSKFMLIHVLSFVDGFDLNGWVIYLVSILQNKGIGSIEAARIASYSGIGCFLVRVILAITQGESKNYRKLFIMSSLFLVTSYAGMYFTPTNSTSSWILLSLFSVALGTGHGILGCQLYNAAASVSFRNTIIAVALVQLLASIAYTISGYVSVFHPTQSSVLPMSHHYTPTSTTLMGLFILSCVVMVTGLLEDLTGNFQLTLILQCSMASLIGIAVIAEYIWSHVYKYAKNIK